MLYKKFLGDLVENSWIDKSSLSTNGKVRKYDLGEGEQESGMFANTIVKSNGMHTRDARS